MKPILFLMLLVLIACNKDTPPNENELICDCQDPITELDWLNAEFKELIGGPELNGIVAYSYQGKEVIEVQGSVFSSTNQHQYYCDGTKLNLDDTQTFSNFRKDRKEIKMIYGTKIW